ncbi:hypothetical protein OPT61_g5417 [Boeremia exigua]|uniref:Uncharacterized protein n=1 Tax=Boeremia exigua TaxID=749465 RepID=A0ACC2IAD7_9PLEO|nr:hypothetical protein OPT61_g5417 [Boeremia exigua]
MEYPALRSLGQNTSMDIFPGLLEWVFDCDAFKRWHRGEGKWQLHCIAGPGSGKTTFATLATRYLRQHSEYRDCPIISVSIDEEVSDCNIDFIEAFLVMVYQTLNEFPLHNSEESDQLYDEYNRWCLLHAEGVQRRRRLGRLRRAVHASLEAVSDTYTFLILDGIDRCGPTVRYMIETELVDLQQMNMRVLLTSRSATFEQTEALCDHERHVDDNPLDMYLQCRTDSCDGFTMCLLCKDADRVCSQCRVEGSLYEPYDHVNIRLWVPSQVMEAFIAWDLEREHGDLRLNSPARKPPLSILGESLRSTRDAKFIRALVEHIAANSYGNIAIARARLDLVHGTESAEGLEARKEQLPATIIALFDRGLETIVAQPEHQRETALKAIAAAARYDDGETIEDLLEQLRGFGIPGIQSGEEIVEATRGWLVDIMVDGPQRLKVYNKNFLFYVEQRYHRAIHRSSIQIDINSRRSSAFATFDAHQMASTARFEPQNVFEEPKRINDFKLTRTVTTMPAIDEVPTQPFIVRKGTVAWT